MAVQVRPFVLHASSHGSTRGRIKRNKGDSVVLLLCVIVGAAMISAGTGTTDGTARENHDANCFPWSDHVRKLDRGGALRAALRLARDSLLHAAWSASRWRKGHGLFWCWLFLHVMPSMINWKHIILFFPSTVIFGFWATSFSRFGIGLRLSSGTFHWSSGLLAAARCCFCAAGLAGSDFLLEEELDLLVSVLSCCCCAAEEGGCSDGRGWCTGTAVPYQASFMGGKAAG